MKITSITIGAMRGIHMPEIIEESRYDSHLLLSSLCRVTSYKCTDDSFIDFFTNEDGGMTIEHKNICITLDCYPEGVNNNAILGWFYGKPIK
jgi:hypothetical protein